MKILKHLVTSVLITVSIYCLLSMVGDKYGIGINQSPSLPEKLFFLDKKERSFDRGDYIMFKRKDLAGFDKATFVKRVAGISGDKVTIEGNKFFINGIYIDQAKEKKLTGEKTTLSKEGIIPQGKYFVYATHKDSFDSRYDAMGLISESDVVGRAYPIM